MRSVCHNYCKVLCKLFHVSVPYSSYKDAFAYSVAAKRGGEGGMRPGRHCAGGGIWRGESADAKVAFFAYHMQQCISAVKLIKLILNVCILGGFHAQKTVCFRGCAPSPGSSPRSPPLFSAFGVNFWLLGARSPFVTPIPGYAYVRVSNNKQ